MAYILLSNNIVTGYKIHNTLPTIITYYTIVTCNRIQRMIQFNVINQHLRILITFTVEPPNKGHFGNGPLVLCSEVVPISEVHDFSTHFDCIILNKLVNTLKCMIRAVEMIIKWLVCSVFSINIAQAEFFGSEVLATPK